eukprot:COSAG06_NODE_39021_length_417_cov_0.899371_2_plen_37_part_01
MGSRETKSVDLAAISVTKEAPLFTKKSVPATVATRQS